MCIGAGGSEVRGPVRASGPPDDTLHGDEQLLLSAFCSFRYRRAESTKQNIPGGAYQSGSTTAHMSRGGEGEPTTAKARAWRTSWRERHRVGRVGTRPAPAGPTGSR